MGGISGTVSLFYSPSVPLTSDYVEASGTATLPFLGPLTVGERVDFEGNSTPILPVIPAPPVTDSPDNLSPDLALGSSSNTGLSE